MYEWDVFISHASEDTEMVVLPLADILRRRGVRLWVDAQELEIGDRLRDKISEGLTRSRFGIVIISPRSASKAWPRNELNALLALEEDGIKRILPVWHDIDRAGAAAAFPLLADRLAGNTVDGIPSLASALAAVILDPRHADAMASPSPARRLLMQLEQHPDAAAIREFLQSEKSIVHSVFGSADSLMWSSSFGPHSVDLALSEDWVSASRVIWKLILLGPADIPLTEDGVIHSGIESLTARTDTMRGWISDNLREARQVFDEIEPGFTAYVICGRRPAPHSMVADVLRAYNDSLFDVWVRTYDWLVDAALKVEAKRRAQS